MSAHAWVVTVIAIIWTAAFTALWRLDVGRRDDEEEPGQETPAPRTGQDGMHLAA